VLLPARRHCMLSHFGRCCAFRSPALLTLVQGLMCDSCASGFFGLTASGCQSCDCDTTGSSSTACASDGTVSHGVCVIAISCVRLTRSTHFSPLLLFPIVHVPNQRSGGKMRPLRDRKLQLRQQRLHPVPLQRPRLHLLLLCHGPSRRRLRLPGRSVRDLHARTHAFFLFLIVRPLFSLQGMWGTTASRATSGSGGSRAATARSRACDAAATATAISACPTAHASTARTTPPARAAICAPPATLATPWPARRPTASAARAQEPPWTPASAPPASPARMAWAPSARRAPQATPVCL
jgi:hypothetical protein